jgi:tetratricopeptide (TPR) repeat protein
MRPLGGNPLIAEGDYHYARRQDGRVGARASQREISMSISSYDSASRAPDTAEARWKLARALYFKASYTGLDADAQKALYEKARRAGDEAIEIVQRRSSGSDLSSDADAAPSYFWSAVAWGQWALLAGKLESAKTGVADKIRTYATTVIGIDPNFEEGGGYRVLGRLHDQAPWIPFLTGWVSREEALKNLRLAVATNGENFVNRLFLAEALASGSSAEAKEAVSILERLVADGPSPTHLVEDLNIQEDARRDLAQWKK